MSISTWIQESTCRKLSTAINQTQQRPACRPSRHQHRCPSLCYLLISTCVPWWFFFFFFFVSVCLRSNFETMGDEERVPKLFGISEEVCEEHDALRGLRDENAKYHVPASLPS